MARIVVVDDERSIRVSLREFLRDAGHEVDTAEHADEAMGMLAAEDFDVVVTDIILPRITGVSLLKSIKETSPHVQVILMTGEPTVETAAAGVRAGAFDYLAKPIGKEKLLRTVANAAQLKALEDERRRLVEENRGHQENLERLVDERTAALRESRERLRLLAARLQSAREEERTVMAREMHDELGQALTGLKMDTSWMMDHLPKNQEPLRDRLFSMVSLIDEALITMRRVSSRLRPAVLDDLGLRAAIEWYTQDYATRTGIECGLDLQGEAPPLDGESTTAIFRILEEALTNVARHAEASHVQISLRVTDGDLVMRIGDDGKGISQEEIASRQSIGLIGMCERAEVLRGRVDFNRPPEGGTELVLSVPMGAEAGSSGTVQE